MMISYDPLLVALSVFIGVCGGYICFHLADLLTRVRGGTWRMTLAAAAVAIGGGIWAMHFVGMLAMKMPITITYDVLGTLFSALIAVGITGVALYIVNVREENAITTAIGGTLMGVGISAMHYVGMAAIRSNFVISYSLPVVVASVIVGIGAATMALFFAFRVKNRWKQLPAAVAMGCAISGMHYTAMAAATFSPSQEVIIYTSPALGNSTMAIMITVVAFILFGSSFLLAAPAPASGQDLVPEMVARPLKSDFSKGEGGPIADEPAEHRAESASKVPVQENKQTVLLKTSDVVCVHADSHYTRVCTAGKEYFCNLSISEIEGRFGADSFLRTHRSHIVNLNHVKSFRRQRDQGELIVDAVGQECLIPVSRTKVGDLISALGI